MPFEAWLTLAVVAGVLGTLFATRLAADMVFLAGITILLLFGVLTPSEAFAGLANEGLLTVAVLYVIVAGVEDTGGIRWLVQRVLGRPNSLVRAQTRLMVPVAAMSAFMNNTPVVAMLIPAVRNWAGKFDLAPSKLMIPLSYAAILGGTCTLIGTSTNLVVNGLLLKQAPEQALHLFDLAWVGVPVTLIGIGFILLTAPWLLPDRRPVIAQFNRPREYSVEMLVDEGGPLVGRSIEKAGLRHLSGVYLVEIDRNEVVLPAVSPREVLQAGDRLVFIGMPDSVVELQKIRGLTPATHQVFKLEGPRSQRMLFEAVLSDHCRMIGQSIRAGRFRTRYNAVVIAVARGGERLREKVGDIVLQPGDTLLLEAQPSFIEQQRNSREFLLVSRLEDSSPPKHERAPLALGLLVLMVTAVTLGLLPILEAALLTAAGMLITRCTGVERARQNIDWSVLLVIAAAFGIGTALQQTGVATQGAHLLVDLAGDTAWANLIAIYVATAVFTAVITNNAAAVLMFPIAAAVAADVDANVVPFAIAVMVAASASFATPIGYQTNLMVLGPGGYRASDFLRVGLPLNLVTGVVAVTVIPMVWGF
ncbi:MAG: SLC13 family permease [Halofilum sp. (in: g-proteobacteria)]|nr:SLC13 family permease [Halofilum sp. (in: g-proteobacteria)]